MLPPKKLGFTRRQMVCWFGPTALGGRLVRRIQQGFVGRPESSAEPQVGSFDYRQEPEIWLDFVAETGDGWNATYTVASLLAQPSLEIEGRKLERGKILLLGGDTVHPSATIENYNDRLIGPYMAALPEAKEAQAPDLFALPGDRDRTDGLKLFRERFCDSLTVGGWRTRQSGTYFALRLPHRWWLWAIDIARGDVDPAQIDYFLEQAKELEAGDRVILASAEPSWLGSQAVSRPYQSLESYERMVRQQGGIICLSLAGGRHHYAHYRAEDGEDPKFLVGVGGTFARETHSLPENLELPVRRGDGERVTVKYRREGAFPDPEASRSMMWMNLLLPLKSWDLSFLVGLFYGAGAWIAGAGSGWLDSSAREEHLGGHPLTYLLISLLFLVLILFVEPNPRHRPSVRRKVRGALGSAHALGHLVLAGLTFGALSSLTQLILPEGLIQRWEQTSMPWARALYTLEGLLFGGLAGGVLLGLYLIASNRLLGCHQSTASATLRCPDFKGFLRLHLTTSGLTVYPIGVDRVHRAWRPRGSEDEESGSWFLPREAYPESSARFIEKPIEIEPRDRSQRTGEEPAESSSLPWQIEEPPTELLAALAAGECWLFAGSGVAAQAGLPTRREMLFKLIDNGVEDGHIDPAEAASLESSLKDGRKEAVANELLHLLTDGRLERYLEGYFSGQRLSRAHELLREIPFAGVIGAGLDTLLEKAFKARKVLPLTSSDGEVLTEALRQKRFFSLALFGSAGRPGLLLTERQLREAIARNRHLAQFLETVFRRHTLLFLGTGLLSIRNFLESLQLASGERPDRPHFALVGESQDFDPVEARYLEREYRIHVLSFPPRESYPELVEFLKRLRERSNDSGSQSLRRERPILERVRLTHIGPFTRLSVELTPSWNMLLGDNGVGKTFILRSIAAALCGEDANPAAVRRLLKSDADWGMIELEASGRSYSVELRRDADGEVEIVSNSLSPLKLDNWLVIGFPALRSVTWARPRGPASEERSPRPSPEDLLPILVGDPDDRLADLKQWLLNLDYQASPKGNAGKRVAARRARKLYERFFEVLDQLTPGLALRPLPIDRQAREVTVESDGRPVPLSAVSQGTASVICWVGTLLQRLHEVNADDKKDPEARGALVLVDEIDAHMHPAWQRQLTLRLSKLFPKVQMVATTHSPLIVGSLAPGEIQLVRRAPLLARKSGIVRIEEVGGRTEVWMDRGPGSERAPCYRLVPDVEIAVEDGESVEEGDELTRAEVDLVAEPLPFDIRGWRADQILTGPLFELQSARNPEVEEALSRYTSLAAQEEHSEEEHEELARLAKQLEVQLPNSAERQEAREAYAMIEEAIAERTRKMDPKRRQRLIEEVKVQLQESVTGSRRPM